MERARRLVCLTLRWGTTSAEERRHLVERVRPGGILLFGGTMASLKEELDDLRARVPHPLVVLSDVERGVGQQVAGGTSLPPPAAVAAAGDVALARDAGLLTGLEMRRAGIDVALAPVLDVQSPAGSAIIGTRSFGFDPDRVAALGCAFLEGLARAGTAGCAKHFPGHGFASGDTHGGRVSDGRDLDAFERSDWIPYRRAIAQGLTAVMAAHLACPRLDEAEPATRSRAIATDLLRGRLGFQGALLSDALTMKAVCDLPEAETARRAVEAGIDLLLDPADPEALAASVEADAASGRLSPGAVSRALRNLDRLATRVPSPLRGEGQGEGSLSALPDRIAERAVTLLKGTLRPGADILSDRSVLILDDDGDFDPRPLRAALSLLASPSPSMGEGQGGGDVILFIPCRPRMNKGTPGLSAAAKAQVARARALGGRIETAVLLGSPWAAADLPDIPTILCAYGAEPASQRAAVRALRGEIPCSGKLPFIPSAS